ncbi:hypothetical protein [Roseobacter sinensis]|nr:hypothetical protein [Roseobacter sp. WL0113]
MREMTLAFAAMAVISVGASYALNAAGFSAAQQGTGQAVRLGD